MRLRSWNLAGVALLAAIAVTCFHDSSYGQPGRFGGDRGGGGRFGGGGPSGGRPGGGRPGGDMTGRIMSMLDQNNDGRVDPSEYNNTSDRMRGFIDRTGLDFSRPVSRDDFQRATSRMMEQFRSSRGGGDSDDRRRSGGGDDRDDGDRRRSWGNGERGDRDDDRNGDRRGNREPAKPKRYQPSKRDPVTVKLPDEYHDADSDNDGQLGMYEWRKWKPTGLAEFVGLDRNGDGFVTPRELLAAKQTEADSETSQQTTTVADRSDDRRSGDFRFRRGGSDDNRSGDQDETNVAANNQTDDAANKQRDEEVARLARRYFDIMDKDNDGELAPAEWGISKRIKPMFEKAEIDISQPMSEEQFVAHYIRVAVPE